VNVEGLGSDEFTMIEEIPEMTEKVSEINWVSFREKRKK
jgi:hypothetical protein